MPGFLVEELFDHDGQWFFSRKLWILSWFSFFQAIDVLGTSIEYGLDELRKVGINVPCIARDHWVSKELSWTLFGSCPICPLEPMHIWLGKWNSFTMDMGKCNANTQWYPQLLIMHRANVGALSIEILANWLRTRNFWLRKLVVIWEQFYDFQILRKLGLY